MGLLTNLAAYYIEKRTGKRVASIAGRCFRDPKSASEADIKTMAASLISQTVKD